jgi:fucokinase
MSGGIDQYKELGWSKHVNSSITKTTAGYNSVLSSRAKVGKDCYLEVSYVHRNATIGDNVVLSYIDIHDEPVPSDVVLHGLKQKDGKFVARIYGVKDNPKEGKLFGKALNEIIAENGIDASELGAGYNGTLWTADMYPACDTIREAVAAALNIYDMVHGKGDVDAWRNTNRKSLCSGFNDADPDAIIAWDNRMQELVRMDGIAKLILLGKPAKEAKDILRTNKLTPIQEQWLEKRLEKADFPETIRLYYYIGTALGGVEGEKLLAKCFDTISETILKGTIDNLQYNENCKITTDIHTVKLPLRVNWGGGWSDTPPYCNEKGGTVLNAAILLNGEKPVEVTLERIPEHKIVFDSRDMDVHGEFDTIEPLQATGDPYDSFALQKAALLACGVLPKEGGDLDDILTRLGGGFIMHSEVTNVPKGSGLGTSSILSAACVKAIFEFMGIEHTEDDLYQHVLVMEQLMSTGGGWQDQVGGVTPGIKYITTMPGIAQKIKVSHVEIPEETKKELNERFVLIYTGQRRLARNLLRDVVGRYVGNEPDSLFALNEIQKVAALMKFELERGNLDEFATLLNYHWELSQKVDKGSTNTLIDQIFASVDEFAAGKLVCGAGGGGFLQILLKKGVDKAEVRARLKEVFQDSAVDVWDCTLV